MTDRSDLRSSSGSRPAQDFDPAEGNQIPVDASIPADQLVLQDRFTRQLWQHVRSDSWRRVQATLREVTVAPVHPSVASQILQSSNPDNGRSLLQELLRRSAPCSLLDSAFNAGVQFTALPKETRSATTSHSPALPIFTEGDIAFSFTLNKSRQTLTLIKHGAPLRYCDSEGNTVLHQLANQISRVCDTNPHAFAQQCTSAILAADRKLADHRNHRSELPIILFARQESWAALELLANNQASELPSVVNRSEAYLLAIWALAKNAPLSTLQAVENLIVRSNNQTGLSGVPAEMLGILVDTCIRPTGAADQINIDRLLGYLQNRQDDVPPQLLTHLLNARLTGTTIATSDVSTYPPASKAGRGSIASARHQPPTLLHAAYLLECSAPCLKAMIQLGADPGQTFTYLDPRSGFESLQTTLTHTVVREQNAAVWNILPDKKNLLTATDNAGEMPVHTFAGHTFEFQDEEAKNSAKWIARVLAEHSEKDPVTTQGLNVADILLIAGGFETYKHLTSTIPLPTLLDASRPYPSVYPDEEGTIDAGMLLLSTVNTLADASADIRREAAELVYLSRNIYNLYLYACAYREMTSPEQHRGEAFMRLMPEILYNQTPYHVQSLLHKMERYHDTAHLEGALLPSHVNEAEIYLLLAHPKLSSLAPANVNFLTSALTSVARFIDQEPPVRLNNGEALENWARLGLLTHSHLRYKYDARQARGCSGETVSLLEEFGFRQVPQRVTDLDDPVTGRKGFGNGFMLRGVALDGLERSYTSQYAGVAEQIDPETIIELRRGYYLISLQEMGTTLIRNSSLVFGRDLLEHPAYYSEKAVGDGFSLSDLAGLTPQFVKRYFHHCVSPELHHDMRTKRINERISYLLSQLKIVQQEYAAWKFDTNSATAFVVTESGKRTLGPRGAWRSPGFREIVARLAAWSAHPEKDPERGIGLAFVHPHLPPWNPYPFIDEKGRRQSVLHITPRRLEVLQDLCNGGASNSDLIDTGIRGFFQLAGMNTLGELIIIDSTETE